MDFKALHGRNAALFNRFDLMKKVKELNILLNIFFISIVSSVSSEVKSTDRKVRVLVCLRACLILKLTVA